MSDRTYQDLRKQIVRAVSPDHEALAIHLDPTDSELVRQKLAEGNRRLAGDLRPTADQGIKIMGIPCVLDADRTEVVFQ